MRLPLASLLALLSFNGIAFAQASLFDQPLSPATPPAALPPGATVAPAPAAKPATPAPRLVSPAKVAPIAAAPAPAAPVEAQPAVESPPVAAKRKPKPRGPVPARVLTISNESTNTLTDLAIAAGTQNVSLGKALGPGEKAELKLPKLKECGVTVTATFEKAPAPDTSDYDICKGRILHFTD